MKLFEKIITVTGLSGIVLCILSALIGLIAHKMIYVYGLPVTFIGVFLLVPFALYYGYKIIKKLVA